MAFFLGVCAVFGIILFLPVVVAFAGVFLVGAIIVGAIWLICQIFASSLWWGMVAAILLALFAFFFWPVLLFV